MALPPPLQNSHNDGSRAALRLLFLSLGTWETLYRISGQLLSRLMIRYPNILLLVKDSSNGNHDGVATNNDMVNRNGNHTNYNYNHTNNLTNGNSTVTAVTAATTADSNPKYDENAKQRAALLERGPSYMVSFVHSIYATLRGCLHLCQLWNASHLDKLLIPGDTNHHNDNSSYRWAHLDVATTNIIFLSYLLYDLCHVLHQYPKLGGVDTIAHHLLFAACSFINGTFGLFAFAFGWLVVGEGSTVFLNVRWYLLKSGRDKGRMIDAVQGLFALTFFATRIIIYSAGMIHLLYNSREELVSLPELSGVPWAMLGMTCGCMILGWLLNIVWGYKILLMVVGDGVGGSKSGKTRKDE